MPKPQTECYSETQESYYLETNTARPGQSYGQAYGESPCSVTQTHGYLSGHAQNGSHHQASYGMACHGKTGKHKKTGNMCKTKCKTGYQSGSDSGSDCEID
ncbi:hypothetical protein C1H46_034872 [Malus baccata]|uniref:Uncharacterized protein n=1 Tax=Malus baccata TaxID=106549 RepID=A0A540KZR3_MALBA|nr:hypothetical protein C1H46_034872 [Malus baccata]